MVKRNVLGVLAAVCLSSSVGCVSTGKYDAAVQSAEARQAELLKERAAAEEREASLHARLTELEGNLAQLQRSLDEATAENAQLRQELARLGTNADALLAEKGVLSAALEQSKARLEELRRAQAATELRAKQYQDLASRLQKMVDAGDLRVVLRDGRMVLQLPNDVLFASGKTDIKPHGQEALKQIAGILKTLKGRNFQVAGHTDNEPIALSRFASNWDLSTARSLGVVKFLIEQGMAPEVLSSAGYGEFDPVAANDGAQGKAQNRRIEIVLQPNVDELVSVPELR